ncbi:putative recobination related endonuclease [Erwinia phage vB_EamM_Yoloswag]|uniref:Putative recobination related endonuclease n=1 Tax=Erwinia phage vB_EamM_Yoloswag TaxID=1958956 RepID=A0A1S6L3A7_9CAUD|nr:putative recobination related endonuclease [Erwinia phage vB_EamM_Yoloswag]AQT28660.1 putative recobination related endonuclease [Erwinia phage vB_EamM_Yoloswag]
MLEAIVCSDWHLEGLAKHFPQDHVERQLETIDRVYQYAVEHGIKYMIVPGDITDKYRMSDDTKRLLLQHFLKYEGVIETYYSGGNHDWADSTQTSMDLIQQFTEWSFLKSLHIYLRPKQLKLEDIVVNFLPHPAKESIRHKKPCLNFCHVEAVGALGDNGRPLHAKKDIAVDERDYTISGHIHLYQHLEEKRFLYCGSPYQKTFGEALPKGYVHIQAKYVKNRLIVKHKFIDSKPGFRLETVLIDDQRKWSQLEANPAIRYRLIVRDGISIPADIRIRIPNISQINTSNKSVDLNNIDTIDVSELELSEINPKDGLTAYLKESGISKPLRKRAKLEIDSVLSEIGYTSA